MTAGNDFGLSADNNTNKNKANDFYDKHNQSKYLVIRIYSVQNSGIPDKYFYEQSLFYAINFNYFKHKTIYLVHKLLTILPILNCQSKKCNI